MFTQLCLPSSFGRRRGFLRVGLPILVVCARRRRRRRQQPLRRRRRRRRLRTIASFPADASAALEALPRAKPVRSPETGPVRPVVAMEVERLEAMAEGEEQSIRIFSSQSRVMNAHCGSTDGLTTVMFSPKRWAISPQ